jgi:hypothetical protein
MNDTRGGIQENYRWTAYMKLKGQTWARKEEDILDEFDGFVQSLRGVGVDYNIIVMVEGRVPRQLHFEYKATETDAKIARQGSGA